MPRLVVETSAYPLFIAPVADNTRNMLRFASIGHSRRQPGFQRLKGQWPDLSGINKDRHLRLPRSHGTITPSSRKHKQNLTMAAPLYESNLTSLNLINRGKVRDIYDIDDQHMLIVTTDRLSAFDVIMSTPIPDKGRVLTTVSNFWFDYLSDIVPNHLASRTLEDVLPDAAERASVEGQATVVRKLRPLPVEAIVRGYIIGSGWKDYQATGSICGIRLPAGLRLADKLEQAIYTPSTKADIGDHDENVDFETTVKLLGRERAEQVRDVSLKLYAKARDYAAERGIIIADTKFEFGLDDNDQLVLIDEALTPDSSRFWPAESYAPGTSPESYDKQYIRDWLEAQEWDKTPPAPTIPDEIIARTTEKYREACRKLTGQELD